MQDSKSASPAPLAGHSTAAAPVVECRNLWKVFGAEAQAKRVIAGIEDGSLDAATAQSRYGCFVAVRDVNLSIRRAEVFCIMGLSGSGKSTLLRHVNRLVRPTAGDVLVNGVSTSAMNEKVLRQFRATRVGMVFQHSALLPHRTAGDNVTLALELRGQSRGQRQATRERLLELVGLAGWGDHPCSALSGGMQQRIGLARALAADPEILLMDEPFSALDPLIRQQLQRQFKALSEKIGKTTIFITHDLDEAIKLGDRIAIMKGGRIVQVGTPEQIVANPADDYVKSFVEGVSRVHLVTAGSIMRPLDEATAILPAANAEDIAALPAARASDDVNHLLGLYLRHESAIAIRDGERIVGLVGIRDVLAALKDDRE